MEKMFSFVVIMGVMIFGITACNNTESGEDIFMSVDTDYPAPVLEEMMKMSDLVVEAQYKKTSAPFAVKPYNGGDPMAFMDHDFEIVEVFKGEKSQGDSIQIRTRRGEVTLKNGDKIVTTGDYDGIHFSEDERYLLFLTEPIGSDYDTQEDYYNPLYGPNGFFQILEDGKIKFQIGGEIFTTLEELNTMEKGGSYLEYKKESWRQSYESGNITEQEYEELLRSLNSYGERIE